MQSLRPITLSVKRGQFRVDDTKSDLADAEFNLVRKEILDRDNHTCQFCGFYAEKYQDVHHLNDKHDDNRYENLVTACVLCHMCHHIGFAGANKRGTLIYLDPDYGISQAGLNQLVRALWIGELSSDTEARAMCVQMLSRLQKCSIVARRQIGTSDPTRLGDFLLSIAQANYGERGEKLEGIYLLPEKAAYEQHIAYWKQSIFKPIPAQSWARIAHGKLSGWVKNEHGEHAGETLNELLEFCEEG